MIICRYKRCTCILHLYYSKYGVYKNIHTCVFLHVNSVPRPAHGVPGDVQPVPVGGLHHGRLPAALPALA